jgi:hypothetical protein
MIRGRPAAGFVVSRSARSGAAAAYNPGVQATRDKRTVYRMEGGACLIELKVRELRQLFHRLDPAPFREKDLDPDAADYIEDAVRELGLGQPAKIVVHLPPEQHALADTPALSAAFANYFSYRAGRTRTDLRRLLARALANLAIGLLFLFACLSLRRTIVPGSFEVLREGLLIIGWVALWRPVEMFLYDWWPLLQRARHLESIANMAVEIR